MKEEERAARDTVFEQTVQIYQNDHLLAELCQGYFNHGWHAAIAYAKREQQWIPVSERLPEQEQRVLLTTFYGSAVFEGHRSKYGRDQFIVPTSQGDSYYKFEHITAWRPLPEPYQPKTDGDLTVDALTKMTPTEIAALDWADVRRVLSGKTDGDKAEDAFATTKDELIEVLGGHPRKLTAADYAIRINVTDKAEGE